MIRYSLQLLLRVYQATFRPILGPRCRFFPSCSDYAIESLERHGAIGGLGLTFKRLCRCHPLSEGGLDPVPQRKTSLLRLWIPNE